MPTPPKQIDPGHRIDPSHNGDGRSVQPPQRDDHGQPIAQKPLQNGKGRIIAPGHGQLGQIDRPDVRKDIHGIQDHWNANDHGYDWHDWNGMRVAHHYDEFGYHWWGFYVGSAYFWTRYYNDNYWWFDPYWHRWCWLNDGQWWWQGPDGANYLYTDGGYYQYDDGDNGVVMTPDPTTPVDAPPDQTTPANPAIYSQDGTRSIQITGDGRDAYLYDLTITDPSDPRAQGTWIGNNVAGATYGYNTAVADDGSTTQTLNQIQLSYDDANSQSTVDVNGERRVDVNGDAQTATLNNLVDSAVDPVTLASGVTSVTLTNQTQQDDSGNTITALLSIAVTATDDSGNQTALTFDRDGASLDQSSSQSTFSVQSFRKPAAHAAPAAPTPAATSIQSLQQRMQGSAAFSALKSMSW